MSDTDKDLAKVTEDAVDQALYEQVGDASLVQEASVVVAAHHVPGAPLVRKADAQAHAELLTEPVADTKPLEHVVEYDGVDTRSPEANLASRSNIEPGGAGLTG